MKNIKEKNINKSYVKSTEKINIKTINRSSIKSTENNQQNE